MYSYVFNLYVIWIGAQPWRLKRDDIPHRLKYNFICSHPPFTDEKTEPQGIKPSPPPSSPRRFYHDRLYPCMRGRDGQAARRSAGPSERSLPSGVPGGVSSGSAPGAGGSVPPRSAVLGINGRPAGARRLGSAGHGLRRQQEGGPCAGRPEPGLARGSKPRRPWRGRTPARGASRGGSQDAGGPLPSQVRPAGPRQVKRQVKRRRKGWPGAGLRKVKPTTDQNRPHVPLARLSLRQPSF